MAEPVTGFKRWMFILKFWLLGKTYCNIPKWAKKIARFMCKVLWMFITFSVICVVMKACFGIELID